jgi:NADPH:quinone reductase-like Zn-dependent oxidoreductase
VVVKAGEKTFDAHLVERTVGPLGPNQVLIRMTAAAFNHRDVSILRLKCLSK